MKDSPRPLWRAVFLAVLLLAAARALLIHAQDGYFERGLPALAWWSLSRHFLAGVLWALPTSAVFGWALRRLPTEKRGLRGALILGVVALGFVFVTCRAPLVAPYVPRLESTRGWAGNVAGFVAALSSLFLFLWTPRWRTVPRVFTPLGGVLVLAAVALYLGVPAVHPWEEPAPLSIAFEDVTEEVGISCNSISWAIAWGDYNADGWPDAWLGNHGATQLYVNRSGRFERVPPKRFGFTPGDSHGAAWADFDADGDQDMLELVGAGRGVGSGPNHLYVSEGDTLVERAVQLGIDHPLGRGRAPLWVDWNGDGNLDAVCLSDERPEAQSELFLQRDGAFHLASSEEGFSAPADATWGQLAALTPSGAGYLVLNSRGRAPQRVFDLGTDPPRDVTQALGIPSTADAEDVAIADLDGDLEDDLFVVRRRIQCELVQPDDGRLLAQLYTSGGDVGLGFRASGPVTFDLSPTTDQWWEPGMVFIGGEGHHPDEFPFRLEPEEAAGRPELPRVAEEGKFVRILWDAETELWSVVAHGDEEQVTVEVESDGPIGDVAPIGFHPSTLVRNELFVQTDGRFTDVTDIALVQRELLFEGLPRDALLGYGTSASGVVAGDFDNDMDVDLYVVSSTEARNLENIFYENLGDLRFRKAPGAGGAPGSTEGIADSVAVADFDRDGFLDLLISNGRGISPLHAGPVQLYRNGGNDNHWLEIDLEGTTSNRDAIGARVLVTAGGRTQMRFQGAGVHRGAQDFKRLHFGLGMNETVSELTVHWPSGQVTTLEDVAVDQVLHVKE